MVKLTGGLIGINPVSLPLLINSCYSIAKTLCNRFIVMYNLTHILLLRFYGIACNL